MTLGLNRGCVKLLSHQEEWHTVAQETISLLSDILGDTAVDIQHIGSTAIRNIKAKPIIDIAVGVRQLDDILPYIAELENNGIISRGEDVDGQLLFVIGNFEKYTRSHHIHIVVHNSDAWKYYIEFRDFLNKHPEKAEKYQELKQNLAQLYPDDRIAYTSGKQEFINQILSLADDLYHKEKV